jgi:Phosphodiester glycosidase
MKAACLRILQFALALAICVATAVCVIGLWYFNRPLPTLMTDEDLFQGITYSRSVRHQPHPMIVHVLRIDLNAEGIRLVVSPRDHLADYEYAARTTSQFVAEHDVQVAINGDFFDPWWANNPFDYYPHVGDGVNIHGLTMANGAVVSAGFSERQSTLFVGAGNVITFDAPPSDGALAAISGFVRPVRGGVYVPYAATEGERAFADEPNPRTALALTRDGRTLLLIVIDGRQPNYSEGATLAQLGAVILEYGGWEALNLDGGGSSTMVVQSARGEPLLLNSPIHTRIPYRERPVANHLGVYALPLAATP